MAVPAKAFEPVIYNIRRFNSADLTSHGGWIMKRLTAQYPTRPERYMANWLQNLVGVGAVANESLFLWQEHGVALFQLVNTFSLDLQPVVQERFVWAEDPDNISHIDAAAAFYGEAERWAKSMSVDKIIVEEMTDVPHEKIKEYLGRIYTVQTSFARC